MYFSLLCHNKFDFLHVPDQVIGAKFDKVMKIY